jgi:3-oxoacyl-[acyl-carrier protein] reductase
LALARRGSDLGAASGRCGVPVNYHRGVAVTISLAGQTALITGGSRGIGAACVRLFVEAGARVVFSYHHSQAKAEALARVCGKDNCQAVQADLSTHEAAKPLIEAAVAQYGRLDALVVNHGIWPPEDTPVDRMSDEQWSGTMATNLNSVFGLVKYAVAQMKRQIRSRYSGLPLAARPTFASHDTEAAELNTAPARKEETQPYAAAGHIVIVSSTAGQRGEAYHCDYAATKGAVISMVKGLSTELAPHAIYVNCVAPGWVATDMAAPALADAQKREKILSSIPLGRVATPEEIAAPILFLCSAQAGFITGEILNVNGGAVLAG